MTAPPRSTPAALDRAPGARRDGPWRPAGPLLSLAMRYVVGVFFDDWRDGDRWRLREGWADGALRAGGVEGSCHRHRRVITVAPPARGWLHGDPRSVAALIHEVVHATTSADHDAAFRRRLERAAARAGAIGAGELQALLLRDLANCEKAAWTEEERRLYSAASDAMARLGPAASLADLERHLARTFPDLAASPRPLRERYPSLERVHRRELQRVSGVLAPRAWPWSPRGD